MKTEAPDREQVFFFPKNNPPLAIRAKNREAAERKLKDIKDVKDK